MTLALALPVVGNAGSPRTDVQEVHVDLSSLDGRAKPHDLPRIIWQTFGNGETFLSVITDKDRYRSISVTPWMREERGTVLGEWQKLPSFGITQQKPQPPTVVEWLKQDRRLRAMSADLRLGELAGGAKYWLHVEVLADGFHGSHTFSRPVDLRNN